MDTYAKPLPRPTPDSLPFWEAARRHELLLPYCPTCDRYLSYPRALCPDCWSDALQWHPLPGSGTLYSYTVARVPSHPQFTGDTPYLIAIVELDEGPRLTTNLVDCDPAEVRIGMRVMAVFEDVAPELTLVKFRPA